MVIMVSGPGVQITTSATPQNASSGGTICGFWHAPLPGPMQNEKARESTAPVIVVDAESGSGGHVGRPRRMVEVPARRPTAAPVPRTARVVTGGLLALRR
jgi:hypothetical protein